MATLALQVVVVTAALALGGVPIPVQIALLALALAAAWLAHTSERRRNFLTNPAFGLWLLLFVATLVQVVPLPHWLHGFLSPQGHGFWQDTGAGWYPISLEPAGTRIELGKLCLYFLCMLAATMTWRRSVAAKRLAQLTALCGLSLVAVGALHAGMGWDRPLNSFGEDRPGLVSLFTNPNHLAAYLGFASFAAMALVFETTTRLRLFWLLAAGILGASVMLTTSRGATVAWLLVASLVVAYMVARPTSTRQRLLRGLVAISIAVCIVIAAWPRLVEHIDQTLAPEGLAKINLWRPVPAFLHDYWRLGAGRGAFASAYAAYNQYYLNNTSYYIENTPLQLLCDIGVPLGLVFLVLMIGLAIVLWRVGKTPAERLLWFGLLFLAVQNLADFSFETPAIALLVWMTLAVLFRPRAPVRAKTTTMRWALAAAAGLGGWSYTALGHTLHADTEATKVLLADSALTTEVLLERIQGVARRHPADPVIPLMVAEKLARDPATAAQSLHFVNRAMLRAPYDRRPHLIAGRALLALKRPQQALLEYRLAAQAEPTAIEATARDLQHYTKSYKAAAALAPGLAPDIVVRLATLLLNDHVPNAALKALEQTEQTFEVRRLLALTYLSLQKYDDARGLATELIKERPTRPEAYLVAGRADFQQGRPESGTQHVLQGYEAAGRDPAMLEELVQLLIGARSFETANTYNQRLLVEGTAAQIARAKNYAATINNRSVP